MAEIGLAVPESGFAHHVDEALSTPSASATRSSFARASSSAERAPGSPTTTRSCCALPARVWPRRPSVRSSSKSRSPDGRSIELEVMRDAADNCVVICSIENVDPMGVHTGDSITVAPQQTLSDVEYQAMRDDAFAVLRRVGVETGGSNVQFAVNPATGERLVIEMNPRVSRSSALASKATGFPIAKIAARLAVGYTLNEIDNDITKVTPASFEPVIDYVVTKIPRWAFEKLPGSSRRARHSDAVGRRGDGDRTKLRRIAAEGVRSLEQGRDGFVPGAPSEFERSR